MGNSKYDTFSSTIWKMVRVQDVKVFGEGEKRNVILTFCDGSKSKDTIDIWIDAYVEGNPDFTSLYQKGDIVCITGKLRIRMDNKGNPRGRVYDAVVEGFAPLKERMAAAAPVTKPTLPEGDMGNPEYPPAFE
jgi:hypothetical protein